MIRPEPETAARPAPQLVIREPLASFLATLGVCWVALGVVAWEYARLRGIPARVATPLAASFLLEITFYLWPAFAVTRAWLSERGKYWAALTLTLAGLAPWLIYSAGVGTFHWAAFLELLAIVGAVSFWYAVVSPTELADSLFLVMLAALVLAKVFDRIYLSPSPRLQIAVLGQLMLVHTAALAIFTIRGHVNVEFRFLPNKAEWATGARFFVMMLPFAAAVYWILGLVHLRPHPLSVPLAAGTFFAILWVVALSEEFFFRGLLQQWLANWTRRGTAALIIASIVFGAAHLGFHGVFPNWRFATVAAVAGFFYGLAWRSSGTIQASMVTHALTVTLWRVFLE